MLIFILWAGNFPFQFFGKRPLKKTDQKKITGNAKDYKKQMQSNDNPFPQINTISNNVQKQITDNKDQPSQQLSFIDCVFSDSFLIKCYMNHKIPTYHNYKNLKKEMERENPKLKDIDLDTFKDRCQNAFGCIKEIEQTQYNIYGNFLNFINSEYDSNNVTPNSNFDSKFHSIHCGPLKKEGPWSKSEPQKLINVIIDGYCSKDIFNDDSTINWIKISSFIIGRTPKSCYDQFKSLDKGELLLSHQKNFFSNNFNPMLLSAFTDFEEEEMITDILDKINKKMMVTLNDVRILALRKYYSPISISTRYLVIKSIQEKNWPFDDKGGIVIDDFENKIENLLEIATNEPQKLIEDAQMREFSASYSWCRRFIERHGLCLRKFRSERRGQINKKFIKKYLKELAHALLEFGPDLIVNMDETFVPMYNYGGKIVGKRGAKQCEVIHGQKYNSKDGATVIATSLMEANDRIPLAIVAKGRTKRCEKKFNVTNNDDIIMHSPSGWTNTQVIIKYLDWISHSC